jgi:hypothetical protein
MKDTGFELFAAKPVFGISVQGNSFDPELAEALRQYILG